MEMADVPAEVVERLRAICLALPETSEHVSSWAHRWVVRRSTFMYALSVESADGLSVITMFRSEAPELEVLRAQGHPFFTPGWGANTVGMVIDEATDWDEVAELATESYCIQAPKKLAALVERPEG